MKNHMITGIGCFAKPEKLNRIFLKMMQNYTLGPIEGFELTDSHKSDKTESNRLLKALLAGKAADLDASGLNTDGGPERQTITGFFLSLKDQKLKLSIFAKKKGCRRQRHSAILDEFSKVRQKRLN